jgi:molybdate transport system regulatory protein
LQLAPGRRVIALIKSSFLLLARLDGVTRVSVQNRLDGTMPDRVDGGVNTEIEIDIGGQDVDLVAIGLRTGEPVSALLDAGYAILVVD